MGHCNCSNPPGGGVHCQQDQIAICRVENGECRGYCVGREEFNNFLLSSKRRFGRKRFKFNAGDADFNQKHPIRRFEYGSIGSSTSIQRQYLNWALQEITGQKRDADRKISNKDLSILLGKSDVRKQSKFSLPDFISETARRYKPD